MEYFYVYNTSGDGNDIFSDIGYDHYVIISHDDPTINTFRQVINVLDWIIVCSGLPLTLVAIAAVYSLVGKDHVAPIYVINLLVSDVIQLCCLAAWKAENINYSTSQLYGYGLRASVGFMVCISLERYLMITQPLWFRFRRNIWSSVVACILVWILPLVCFLPVYLKASFQVNTYIHVVYLLLPFPLFIFFLVGTVRALSAARSVPADEKQRIVAVLVVVLLIYTLLFLPNVIFNLVEEARKNQFVSETSSILIRLSPLADMTLYVFIRKGVADKFLASLSCC